MSKVTTFNLTCLGCGDRRAYKVSGMHLVLFTNGIHAVHWFCVVCREESYLSVDSEMAMGLERLGVGSQVIPVPLEVLEWPQVAPKIKQEDVDLFRRAAHKYFEKKAWELADVYGNDS